MYQNRSIPTPVKTVKVWIFPIICEICGSIKPVGRAVPAFGQHRHV